MVEQNHPHRGSEDEQEIKKSPDPQGPKSTAPRSELLAPGPLVGAA